MYKVRIYGASISGIVDPQGYMSRLPEELQITIYKELNFVYSHLTNDLLEYLIHYKKFVSLKSLNIEGVFSNNSDKLDKYGVTGTIYMSEDLDIETSGSVNLVTSHPWEIKLATTCSQLVFKPSYDSSSIRVEIPLTTDGTIPQSIKSTFDEAATEALETFIGDIGEAEA